MRRAPEEYSRVGGTRERTSEPGTRPRACAIRNRIECAHGHPNGHPDDPTASVATGLDRTCAHPDQRASVALGCIRLGGSASQSKGRRLESDLGLRENAGQSLTSLQWSGLSSALVGSGRLCWMTIGWINKPTDRGACGHLLGARARSLAQSGCRWRSRQAPPIPRLDAAGQVVDAVRGSSATRVTQSAPPTPSQAAPRQGPWLSALP
jgi:hypothetical protein